MKKLFKGLMLLGLIAISSSLVACKGEIVKSFTVTFETGEGGSPVASQSITQGKKVNKPADPTNEAGDQFVSWQENNRDWVFEVDIVSKDLTLQAKWMALSSDPVEVNMENIAFSNTLTWYQQNAETITHQVYLKQSGDFTLMSGEKTVETNPNGNDFVKYTFDNVIGGEYYVRIVSNNIQGTEISEPFLFKGKGQENNPYLVAHNIDLFGILSGDYLNGYYKQIADLENTAQDPIIITTEKITFNGTYDGNNKSITFQGNSALFHQISSGAVVKNLTITGTVVGTNQDYAVGALTDNNLGLIDNVKSTSTVTDEKESGTLAKFVSVKSENDTSTGAGSIAGVNGTSGQILNSSVSGSGAVKAGIGAGAISAYNYGLIQRCSSTATLPAGNQANSGNSSSTYSFGGGLVGFNYGTINQSSVTGRVFAQSAYADGKEENELKNVAFGGIAGYNKGTINEVSFTRSLSSKEFISKSKANELGDQANNLGVASIHGDAYVGGLVGINAGTISNSYVGGALIGGRDFVGGIAGKSESNSNIASSYVLAEIAIKDTSGNLVNTANAKTTLTKYEVAPLTTASTFHKELVNPVSLSSWKSGDNELPTLPSLNESEVNLINANNKFNSSGILKWQEGGVTGVNITPAGSQISIGQTVTLTANVLPSNAPDQFVSWSVENETVIEQVGDGVFKGLIPGSSNVTVTTRDGGFSDTVNIVVGDYNRVTDVNIFSPEITLPVYNDSSVRPDIEQNTTFHLKVVLGPNTADYLGFDIKSSNSRATVGTYDETDGALITVINNPSNLGNFSITVGFADPLLIDREFRFKAVPAPVIPTEKTVTVTSPDITLPAVNTSTARPEIEVGTTFHIVVEILPLEAENREFTITISNSRATAGAYNETEGSLITVVNTGDFSVYIDFVDANFGRYNYRFTAIPAPVIPTEKVVTITSSDVTMPEANGGSSTKVTIPGANFQIKVQITGYDGTDTINAVSSTGRATVVVVDFVAGIGYVNVTFVSAGNFTLTITVNDTAYAYRFEFSA
ncbi:MAG: Ig-like domain-containing protein [Bacillales bacterium]|jgi:hypothetical protein|nr:Ig-like domain-containing protein [Bacillales bacterium]